MRLIEVEMVFPYELGCERPWVLPPLGMGYLASALKKKNIVSGITDCTFMGLSKGIERVKRLKPRVVGVYSMVTMGANALRFARAVRKDVDLLVAGGPLPTVYPDNFIPEFDVCMRGEADHSFPILVERFLENDDYSDVPGVAYNDGGKVKFSKDPTYVLDLDSLPHPFRFMFPIDRYREYWMENFGYHPASIIATRGCPLNCDFCSRPVSGSNFRKRNPEDIKREVEGIWRMGYDHLWFADDAFTLDRDFVFEVCQSISQLETKVKWDCLSRVNGLDTDLIKTMKKAGLSKVFLGIESGSDETLRLMKKGIKVEDSILALELLGEQNVATHGFFMIGYPGESLVSMWNTVEFSVLGGLDEISFTVPYPLPGSALYERYKGQIDPKKEWLKERENTLFINTSASEKTLRRLMDIANTAHGMGKRKGRSAAIQYLARRRREFFP